MARLLADENFPLPVTLTLQQLGHDVVTLREAGLSDRQTPDATVLAFGTKEDRAVLTLNRRDFLRLHREQPQHAGIVACTFDPDFEGQAQRIHAALEAQGPLAGTVVRVNRPA